VVPRVLPWYPDSLAYQLNVTRKDIRRMEVYWKLHNFLIAETESGAISRQETVSMIPPLVLGVEPHHKVLDMCAAPGSKTAQLIEALHNTEPGTLPTGFVVANDKDNSRCYMLTHQAKRLQSPAVVIINHDASVLPNLLVPKTFGSGLGPVKFDRILADVPCTGDGTMRKNPDIWPKWTSINGANLHPVQYRIVKRGLELLEVGGRLVYSTCSLNPVENEAVISRVLTEAGDSVMLVEVDLPGLIRGPGLLSWNVSSKGGDLYNSWDQVPEQIGKSQVRPEMFPPAEVSKLNLEKCVRVLPHHQNTGGFFVALLEKVALCPWEKQPKVQDASATDSLATSESLSETEPPQKKRFWGFREDPFIYLPEDDKVYPKIRDFFSLQLPRTGFLTRCVDETKKNNVYLTTPEVRELVEHNKERVKIINTGVKAFVRCENKGAECEYRIAQEGALSTVPFIQSRRVHPSLSDITKLLQSDDMDSPPEIEGMSLKFQEELANVETGSVAYIYSDEDSDLVLEIVGWKGKATVRAYVPRNDRLHYLRLIGADTSKFDTNKFKDKKVRQASSQVPVAAVVDQSVCEKEDGVASNGNGLNNV